MSLFVPGEFWSHSGIKLLFKIECDNLTEREIDLFAELIVARLHPEVRFTHIFGVPKTQPGGRDNGGVLAQYVRRHVKARGRMSGSDEDPILIVDDVLTTGASMGAMRERFDCPCLGAVILARGPCPEWVRPLFTLNELAW